MAQIFAFGRVENDLVPKKSQKDSTYVCFGFTEQTGKGQFQYYQVWAWDDEVSRLIQLGIKKESRLWITGTQRLVDCTAGRGKEKDKVLKIYLSDFGFLPGHFPKESPADFPNDPETAESAPPPVEVLDGERDSLPE